ncbi:Putative pirin domain, rmlC-like cupin domain superfamily, rmlC-like jelly roll [Septoria linicola]|uniref:Pirin domain, rmlC-like cupin domain superfamily, rmlC-like jelly roll n=1 Tax=Septoria linicola TaxID=215465 RepID=A0A9Q9EKD4_9PEZI|nr:putative pirin domain, rmlC-like cupin domain superfamily, rmlC-like jelly roll [Septoria linicola]USW53144.1 Putative pirin domain, rmlC-like cupin domain superfamily, rmlC-like jelly roll [Septoria linicola]
MSSKQQQPPASSTQPPPSLALNYKTAATLIAVLAIILAFYHSLPSALPKVAQVVLVLAEPTNTPLAKRAMSTTATTTANGTSNLNITKRPWNSRGHADHGWLYTFHTFSFASYYDPKYESFGPLRVINEDRVERGTGFGTHSHAEFGIWSYIVNGELEHKDSMGNLEKLRRGEVQFTNAGTGIRHSEYNRNSQEDVHFLQIWAKPNVRGLKPSYCTRKYTDEMKHDRLVRIIESKDRHSGKDGETEPIEIDADVSMDASILSPGKSVEHELVKDGERNVYLHLVMSDKKQPKSGGAKIKVGEVELGEGDGAFVKAKGPGKVQVESVGDRPAEFLLFDMGEQ